MLSVRRGERGFSLIEMVIAVVMLAIVLGTVASASIVSSNSSIRSEAQVKLAAALEQAVERIHVQQPWYGNVTGCETVQTSASGACSYEFEVSSTERFRFRADVKVQRTGTGRTTFDVFTTVTAIDQATGQPVTQLRPIQTSFVKDLRKREVGDIAVFSCRVIQADDRMAGGSCSTPNNTAATIAYSGWTPMAPQHGTPALSDPNQCGQSGKWLLPPYQGYGKTCERLMWDAIVAKGHDEIHFYPNQFTATATNMDTGQSVSTPAGGAPGRFTFTGLERGRYRVTINETTNLSQFLFWADKSAGYRPNGAPGTYEVVVTPGTQARVTRIFEPRPVNVTLPITVGDAAIPWEPRNNDELPVNSSGTHSYAMLIPFPEGRVTIPGVSGAEYSACPGANRNTLVDVCDQQWAKINYNQKSLTFRNVRPGLYRQEWYQSYRDSDDNEWHFKQRNMAKKDLGFGWPTGRWNSTFGQHGRLGFIYVNTNGTVSTMNSPTPYASDSNISIRYPGCTNRRTLLTNIFAEVPEQSDGTNKWIYQSAVDGKVYPQSIWDQMSPGLQAQALSNPGDEAVGWVKRMDRRRDADGEWYSIYRAANGGWNDVNMKTQYRKREYVNGDWAGGLGSEDGRILYYRFLNTDGVWVYLQDDRATAADKEANGRTVQHKVKWSAWYEWRDDPYTINEQDIPETRQVPIEDANGYRTPLANNILYRMYPEVGVTDFTVYDSCTSTDKEVDADKDALV